MTTPPISLVHRRGRVIQCRFIAAEGHSSPKKLNSLRSKKIDSSPERVIAYMGSLIPLWRRIFINPGTILAAETFNGIKASLQADT
jgi:hypothetical protein